MSGRAVTYEGSGRFALQDSVRVPPGKGEVRLDVAYCGICGTDLHIAHGAMDARIPTPMVIGHEMSGTVAEVGAGVDGDPSRRPCRRAARSTRASPAPPIAASATSARS